MSLFVCKSKGPDTSGFIATGSRTVFGFAELTATGGSVQICAL